MRKQPASHAHEGKDAVPERRVAQRARRRTDERAPKLQVRNSVRTEQPAEPAPDPKRETRPAAAISAPDPAFDTASRLIACQNTANEALRDVLDRMVKVGWERREAATALNAVSWNYLLDAIVKRR
jgi:hypothetical protein